MVRKWNYRTGKRKTEKGRKKEMKMIIERKGGGKERKVTKHKKGNRKEKTTEQATF